MGIEIEEKGKNTNKKLGSNWQIEFWIGVSPKKAKSPEKCFRRLGGFNLEMGCAYQ